MRHPPGNNNLTAPLQPPHYHCDNMAEQDEVASKVLRRAQVSKVTLTASAAPSIVADIVFL